MYKPFHFPFFKTYMNIYRPKTNCRVIYALDTSLDRCTALQEARLAPPVQLSSEKYTNSIRKKNSEPQKLNNMRTETKIAFKRPLIFHSSTYRPPRHLGDSSSSGGTLGHDLFMDTVPIFRTTRSNICQKQTIQRMVRTEYAF